MLNLQILRVTNIAVRVSAVYDVERLPRTACL